MVEPPRRLEFTWMSEGTHGLETIVELTFEPQRDGTALHLVHRGFPDDQTARPHEGGGGGFGEDLDKRLQARG